MTRALTPLILLLALASAASAQAPAADGSRVEDTLRAGRHAGQFAIGMSAWPVGSYCSGPMSAAMQQVHPREVLRRVQLAARCGVRLVLVPPRRLLTEGREANGLFSVESAKRLTDQFARELPPDTLRKYRSTILGFNLADDYGCTRCWGGKAITQAQIGEWAAYARTKLPGVPLGVRVVPEWVARDSTLAPLLDYAWAQYHTRKGDAKSFYDKAATTSQRLGLRVIMGVNVKDCYGVGTDPCSAEDLVRYGRMALGHPASCAFINWRYDEGTYGRPEMREVWQGLVEQARKRGAEECRREGAAG
ncbi:MAG: hypothetical protein H0X69_14035 [Gemmatimonadales bacterium]|nr:hypothetical protein [Gemmatimonadales bacterium]